MNHEQTPQPRTGRWWRRLLGVLIACLLVAACFFVYQSVSTDLREQSAASVRSTILKSAIQCCAIEGSYPSSLAYLEEKYGLVINHNDYVVTYEAFAENTMPSVVVVAR